MWRRVSKYELIRSGPGGPAQTPRPRTDELMGGPLDGLTIGRPLEPVVQFILLPKKRTPGSYPVHAYRYVRPTGRYEYCGHQALVRVY